MDSLQQKKAVRNIDTDKTRQPGADQSDFANQSGGKLGAGNENSGHPANNVIAPDRRSDVNPDGKSTAPSASISHAHAGERGTKGSGMPTQSGAGELADDRPGRNTLKGEK